MIWGDTPIYGLMGGVCHITKTQNKSWLNLDNSILFKIYDL